MQTIKLYETDAYIADFTANVISCDKNGKTYDIILDKTAFFPEGGGQPSDIGNIDGIKIVDVQIKDGVIIHKAVSPVLSPNVSCSIDWDIRYSRMQNHTGEHLLSGIAHKMYGCTNVGFHMGNEITVDFDKELTDEDITVLEAEANKAIYKNVSVVAEFPTEDVLKTLDYRSKLELTENIRIVTIDGFDICACCAPHVKNTGEIGLIKILSSMRHRGGTRLQILCGFDAFKDYCIKTDNLYQIAVRLCAKHNQELGAFNKLCDENENLKQKNISLTNELISVKICNPRKYNSIATYFESNPDMQFIRNLALESAKINNGVTAVFSGKDSNYKFAFASSDTSVKNIGEQFRAELSAKGGGSDELIQGNVSASEETIINFLNRVKI